MVTFIIVTWNNEELIENLFLSIKKYCNIDYKIIVIDNNSNDNTRGELEKQRTDNVKIIYSKENLGFAKGNNLALNYVDTEYVCFLNPDTIFIEEILEKLIKKMQENKRIGVIGPKLLNEDKSFQKSFFKYDTEKNIVLNQLNFKEKVLKKNNKAKEGYVDWIIGAMMLMRTSDAKQINGFSEEYYMYIEDMDLCMKINKMLDKKVYYLDYANLIHLGGQSEIKNNNYKKDEVILKNTIKFNEKYFGNGEKIRKKLMFCYRIKRIYTYIAFMLKKDNKSKMLFDKMNNSYKFLKNIK